MTSRLPFGSLPLGRRQLALLGSGLLGAAAAPRASQAAPAGFVLPDPVPCLEREGDLVGLLLEGGARGGQPAIASFGMPFRAGKLPRGAGIAARSPAGQAVPAQLDVVTRHPDGSVRQAVVSLQAPALRAGDQAGVILARGPAANGVLDLAAAVAGRQAMVELTPLAPGGRPWRLDLLQGFQASGAAWQSGPLAVQRRVAVPVPAETAGRVTSLRLVADVSLRADGTLWVDLWLRNDIAMRAGGGTAGYRLRLLLDGREALALEMPRHHQYRAWGRLVGVLPGGRPAPAPPLVRHDVAALAEAGAIAHYDLGTGVDEALLDGLARQMAQPAWDVPFEARGVMRYMPTTGGRSDLGPTTAFQAAWLCSGDPRAAAYCIGQAEAAGSIPWHLWDAGGGADGQGGWLDALRWPRLWTDPRGGPPPRGLLQPIPTDTGWTPDQAHQPDLCFVPYLLTGRRAFADGVMAQAAWNLVGIWPAMRTAPGQSAREEGFLAVQGRQVRGMAWTIRQLDEAAWVAPDGDANQPYLRQLAARNWSWLRAQIPRLTAWQGEAHGWMVPGELEDGGGLKPWQQDYFAAAAAAATRQGNADARAFLSWMANFLVGRFNAGGRGFAPHDGAAYIVVFGRPGAPETPIEPLRSWAEIGRATQARGFSNGTGWAKSQGEYTRLALQSLAQLADLLDHAEARRTYAWLLGQGAPYTDTITHARNPTLNIVPRGMPRTPGTPARCGTAGRG